MFERVVSLKVEKAYEELKIFCLETTAK